MADGLEPIGLAMVICDAIHVDPATGKRTLLGLFSAIVTRELPATIGTVAVYVSITECRGTFPILLQVIDANEDREPIVKIEDEVEYDDPLGMLELNFRMDGLQFPEPGEYRVQFFAANSPVLERRIVVIQPPTQEPSDE